MRRLSSIVRFSSIVNTISIILPSRDLGKPLYPPGGFERQRIDFSSLFHLDKGFKALPGLSSIGTGFIYNTLLRRDPYCIGQLSLGWSRSYRHYPNQFHRANRDGFRPQSSVAIIRALHANTHYWTLIRLLAEPVLHFPQPRFATSQPITKSQSITRYLWGPCKGQIPSTQGRRCRFGVCDPDFTHTKLARHGHLSASFRKMYPPSRTPSMAGSVSVYENAMNSYGAKY